MPVFNYRCESCGIGVRTMSRSSSTHKECGGKLVREPQGASSQKMDTIDNGLMAKKVERLTDVEELAHERAVNDPRITRYQE